MSFGSEYGGIHEERECPRCGSPAVVRIRSSATTDMQELHLTCKKCHYIALVGMIPLELVYLDSKIETLEEALRESTNQRQVDRIQRKIESLCRRREFLELTSLSL